MNGNRHIAGPADKRAAVAEPIVAAARVEDPSVAPVTSSALGSTRVLFVGAILAGQRKEALRLARETLRQGHAVTDVYVELFQEGLYEIGRRWESGEISVAEEHMATASVQYVIAQFYPDLPLAATSRGNAVITGVQGEFHQVGANIIADLLEADGWSVRFLGTNMPPQSIVAAVTESATDLLGISTTMLFNLPHVRALVGEIRESLGPRAPRIVVGGGAFRLSPEFCAELGVEGPAIDLRSAVQLCQPNDSNAVAPTHARELQ